MIHIFRFARKDDFYGVRARAYKSKEKKQIAFFGVDSGVGTTHLAVATANYIANYIGGSVVVIEMGNACGLENLRTEGISKGDLFCVIDVWYHPQTTTEQLSMLFQQDYDYYVFDLGTDFSTVEDTFFRCDRQVIVGSLSLWKWNRCEEFFETYKNKNFTCALFCTLTGKKRKKKECQKRYHIAVKTIPFIADPLWLEDNHLSSLQELL